jgi:hypothetical protein
MPIFTASIGRPSYERPIVSTETLELVRAIESMNARTPRTGSS